MHAPPRAGVEKGEDTHLRVVSSEHTGEDGRNERRGEMCLLCYADYGEDKKHANMIPRRVQRINASRQKC
jgi:hypothetical protein